MFVPSRYPTVSEPAPAEPPATAVQPREGRDSEASRRATAAVLVPRGRPSGWLLLLAACCALVVVQVVAQRLG
ncbi:MAG TPA: hypothetical protein VFM98_07575 [Ramlibacter sp.]|uniref:hypothetical protein n=1 Tax=Ramlibacter sp. TaxID=1917967 RepID=UPI002D7FE4D8|nr:hypothetical protein [Ramlibacter sp.]HET8745448.1 hypothetical protein [Ramlibacter sp.]